MIYKMSSWKSPDEIRNDVLKDIATNITRINKVLVVILNELTAMGTITNDREISTCDRCSQTTNSNKITIRKTTDSSTQMAT